jgi:NAD(P)-dependent dehydrogenase (short-subunit alcohol dehydrogenase family)
VSSLERFDLSGDVVAITGGAGLLGEQHAHAVAGAGGIPVLLDLDDAAAERKAGEVAAAHGVDASGLRCDVTSRDSVEAALAAVLERHGRLDALVNNAARNPKVESGTGEWSRLEDFPIEEWDADVAVGLTGAFICSQVFGGELARRGRGAIVNVASDLAVIGPDQRLYRRDDLPDDRQPVKPVTYSVVKSALVGLTRWLATYWADAGVRVNAISPGGVYTGQPDEFVARLTQLIPMGRMAQPDEYLGAIVFLCSDASAYMTGQNLIVDGGRTAW